MDAVDLHAEAWEGIRKGYEAGRLAHAYLIVGSSRGNALHFVESFLKLLFCKSAERPCNECGGCRRVETHKHVDTMWLEPQSKARQIKADEIRALVHRMSQTSFEGGWKAGVILNADCMNANSANALLKTLEEPPQKSILLLVTDSPQALLPTIISRCQKIVLSAGFSSNVSTEAWRLPLMNILHDFPPANGLAASRLAVQLKGLFDGLKAEISAAVEEDLGRSEESLEEDKLKEILDARTGARLKEMQAEVFRVMLDWQRDVLVLASGGGGEYLIHAEHKDTLAKQAELYSQGSALQAVRILEELTQRLNRNIPDLQVFDEALRRLAR